MKIVICNIQMSTRTGTEIVTRDFALGLKKRGHEVTVLTGIDGELAAELRGKGVRVALEASAVSRPDAVHIHHLDCALPLLGRYPEVPAIYICHDATTGHSYAASHPSIKAFFGVSTACRQRVADDLGVALEAISLLPNFVDLDAAPMRSGRPPLIPRRWLFVAEKFKSEALYETLEALARRFHAKIDAVGPYSGRLVADLPALFLQYDLVFASARCAIEAAATGAGVMVCDPRGLSGFLTPRNWARWSEHNLGLGSFAAPPELPELTKALLHWNPWKAASVSRIVRQERSLDKGLDQLEALYQSLTNIR
jgi:hypothetical protein